MVPYASFRGSERPISASVSRRAKEEGTKWEGGRDYVCVYTISCLNSLETRVLSVTGRGLYGTFEWV